MILKFGAYVSWGADKELLDLKKELATNAVFSFETLGVEEARIINARLGYVENASDAWTLVSGKNITEEAQNALLKSLEDLSSTRGLVLFLPRSTKLLDTLISRVSILDIGSVKEHYLRQTAESFAAMPIAKRVAYAKSCENPDLLDALEELFVTKDVEFARSVLATKRLLREASVSARMAIEHIAYLVPVPDAPVLKYNLK